MLLFKHVTGMVEVLFWQCLVFIPPSKPWKYSHTETELQYWSSVYFLDHKSIRLPHTPLSLWMHVCRLALQETFSFFH